jgi:HEPN domain-containing protein
MVRPEQLHLISQWVEKAEEDYKNAEYTLTLEEGCPVSTVCFHSQQCIEKYLKALLICHSLAVPKSHDLVELYHRLPSDSRPVLSEEGLAILNRYAVESRYPGGWEVILRGEAEDAFRIARTLRQVIRGNLSRMKKGTEGV